MKDTAEFHVGDSYRITESAMWDCDLQKYIFLLIKVYLFVICDLTLIYCDG